MAVYVIGLTIGAPAKGNPDADRLQRIASDTAGTYFPNVSSTGTSGVPNTSLQDVMATISSTLACKGVPVTTQLTTLQATGQSATQSAPVNSGATSANITLNWGNAGNQYRVTKVLIRLHGPRPPRRRGTTRSPSSRRSWASRPGAGRRSRP
ncbi:MAG TPA: hypothetical protein VH231_00095 [Solirubrobacteraceae bacterium]|nr:hypothetical protein [Solirubrobacteraceae bacterium]